MIRSGFRAGTAALLVVLGGGTPAAGQDEEVLEGGVPLRGIMHVPSSFSTGRLSLAQIAHAAVEANVDVVVASDADLVEIRYGLPFVRDLIDLERGEQGMLHGVGAEEYLAEINSVAGDFPELVLLSGVESAPFHFWSLDLLDRRLTVHRRSQHLLAIDLDSPEALEGLPVIGNDEVRTWGLPSLLLMWPLLGFAIVFLVGSRQPLSLRVLIVTVSAICLINNFPFKIPLMNAYHGDIGPGPYQHYIDYVNGHDGLVFWSHPESFKNEEEIHMAGLYHIGSDQRAHTVDLLATQGYAGLAVLTGGPPTVASPGAKWDQVLGQYISGGRAQPAWGIGTAPSGGRYPIDHVLTVFHVLSRTPNGVREALASGRMYAVQGASAKLELIEFSAESDGYYADMGETLDCGGEFAVNIGLARTDDAREEVHVQLVQSGELIASDYIVTPDVFAYDTELTRDHEYVRLLVSADSGDLISNPVFIRIASP